MLCCCIIGQSINIGKGVELGDTGAASVHSQTC